VLPQLRPTARTALIAFKNAVASLEGAGGVGAGGVGLGGAGGGVTLFGTIVSVKLPDPPPESRAVMVIFVDCEMLNGGVYVALKPLAVSVPIPVGDALQLTV